MTVFLPLNKQSIDAELGMKALPGGMYTLMSVTYPKLVLKLTA